MESARNAMTNATGLRLKRRQLGVVGNRKATAIILDDVDIALAHGGGGLMVQRPYRRWDARRMPDSSQANRLAISAADSFR
jgi:hypothetical protein